jgi:hypothetical protein
VHQDVTWPDPEMVEFPVLKEILPVYSRWFEIQGMILSGYLRFQACSQTVCEPPQTVTCALPLTLQPFLISERDRELLKRKASKS